MNKINVKSPPQHIALGPSQKIYTLYDIKEDLILAILDAIRPPGHSIGHCWRGFGRPSVQLESLLSRINVIFNIKYYNVVLLHGHTCVMYSCNIFASVVCGYPKSTSSSRSS